ncbi:MAG: Hpt domain-containing protein [Luteimonas sp.]
MTTALRDAIDYTTLGWIKPELDETMRLARVEIEAFADDLSDASHMDKCVQRLHEVQGTLRMVELYAPAKVAEEMEHLAQALRDGGVAAREEACATLMRGVVLLPDYLERLQGGHRDIPVVLLPLLNDLRTARGESMLDEAVLFSPSLQRPVPDAVAPVSTAGNDVFSWLGRFEAALGAWPQQLAELADASEGLRAHFGNDEGARRMFFVASAVAAALRDGAMEADASLHQIFTLVGSEARRGSDANPAALGRAEAALEPTRQLLYQVARSGADHPALHGLRETFDLDLETSELELAHAQGSLSGHNRALLDTVSQAIKEDLLRVKDALDLFLRSGQADMAGLLPQVAALGTIADTLGMLGLDAARSLVQQQRDTMASILSGDHPADEGSLLDIASALLYVDVSLDEQVARLGGPDVSGADDLLANESRKVTEVLAREAIVNFGDARHAFVAFVETGWHHEELVEVPRLLGEVAGALQMLDLPQPAQYLAGVRAYTERELIGRRRIPGGRQLDTLADALASLEYYLEALREQRGNRDDILEIARNSLESLGYWPIPAAPESAAAMPTVDATDVEFDPSAAIGFAEEAPDATAAFLPPVPAPAAPPAATAAPPAATAGHAPAPVGTGSAGAFEATGDEIDDEIRDIFLEEFEEEIANLGILLAQWREAPEDRDHLRQIRRVFHTLKGSGRLVGARTLGEFAWKTENMLNRVLDGSRAASPAVLALVETSHATLPQLLAALRGEGSINADLEAIQLVADRIGAGEEVVLQGATQPEVPAAPIEVPDDSAMVGIGAEVAADATLEAGVPARVDQVLLEILDVEINGHLRTVDAWLLTAREAPSLADDGLLRAIHTMNGAFAMTEVPAITDAMTPAEAYVKRMVGAHAIATPEGVAALAQLVAAARSTMAALHAESPLVPGCDSLAKRLAGLRDSLPDIAPADQYAAMGVIVDADTDIAADGDLASAIDLDAMDLSGFDELIVSMDVEAEQAPARVEDSAAELESALLEQERIEAERAESERAAAERAEAEHAEAERAEAECAAAERAEAERAAAERAEAEHAEAERAAAERAAAERAAAERVEVERAEAERAAAERAEAERAEAERAEAEEYARLEVEYAEQARVALDLAAAAEAANQMQAAVELPVEPEPVEPSQPHPAPSFIDHSVEDPDEALDISDLDPELVDIFVEEGVDLLDHSDALLAQLHAAPGEGDALIGIQRDLHTLKGGARMAGIMAVGELGHAMESLLEAVVEQRIDLGREGVPLLERGLDRLHAMITRVGARRAIGMPDQLIAEFDAHSRGEVLSPEQAATRPATVPVPAPKVELKPLSAPIGDADHDDDDVSVRAPQEQVRIRADLLDRLVNYAGEVAIYRARLEQQLAGFRTAMGEMEQTNARLRDQLRRLDSETEAQIIARYQRENESADETFDPLELDRFSTLQQLSRALAESAADLSSLQGSMDDQVRQYETLLLQQSRVSSDLQEGLMRTRMVPFDALVPRLRRVLRQAATDTGKQVQLKLEGAQGELDRNVLERMTAPLEHMLRNAVAHGLELPGDRIKAKKDEEGTVRISVRREGSEVVLEVSDDGAGLNRKAIRKRAEQRGLVQPGAVLSDSALDTLIFEPGFSTVDEVSRLAGRGVGMDVVASEVRQLGGTFDITTRHGQGTTFTLHLPQTLAVTQAVFVRIGEITFAVPIASVRGVGRISREDREKEGASYAYGGEDYTLHDLGLLLGHAAARAEGQLQMPLLLIRSGDLRAAVCIDQVMGNREIVVKPVGPQVASLPGIFGATIMGDGSVVVILDIAPLVRRQSAAPRGVAHALSAEARKVPLVMVVDDSVTMRKVTGRVLERNNFEVGTAKDGVDALERMVDRVPDLMLLDIEMPRMDGYELATAMKADPRLRDVPIIMITSRTGEKHRQRAMEIGVNRYLGKPYQENELLRNVFELLAQEQPSG